MDVKKYEVLLIESFYGGSHKVLMDLLIEDLEECCQVHFVSMTAKKWHWRARTGALYISQQIPMDHCFKVIFTSSVLNLAELIALRPDLKDARKIVYFHENQLVYPVQEKKERDFQYGYNQILTCLVADQVIFNSKYNQNSFLESINAFFKLQPDYRPKNLNNRIIEKCKVLYFPVKVITRKLETIVGGDDILHIVWPHRWEHDKDPDTFFITMYMLADLECEFKLSVLGENFKDNPQVFDEAKQRLSKHIQQWSYVENKQDYYRILQSAHVSVSTAKHEFFGVSMLEAVMCGCFPLCPDSLVYPEIYPKQCLYKDSNDLLHRLQDFCDSPTKARTMAQNLNIDMAQYTCETLLPQYIKLFV